MVFVLLILLYGCKSNEIVLDEKFFINLIQEDITTANVVIDQLNIPEPNKNNLKLLVTYILLSEIKMNALAKRIIEVEKSNLILSDTVELLYRLVK